MKPIPPALLTAIEAAAPELLAALEIVLSSTCGDVGDDGYEGCIRIEAKALDRARAAIDKATRHINADRDGGTQESV